ncbi:MAG: glycerol-3-phosphate 1-O-acyltransferase PlsY [Alphaproteobacteria bacterium]|nr:glycerol-3-phosphate 1-O-acyltransferase PlsY [Alphaproteobacteria bacterium]MCB9974349.1 glycerol-3-phosphate 1-O-acyltransferase PlsY [Rhodospirillales bacterium]
MICSDGGLDSAFTIGIYSAYFIGSIPFGLLLTRVCGYGDIRKTGSGNIGATNVLRTGNKKLAFVTLLLDSIKGALPILLVWAFAYTYPKHCLGYIHENLEILVFIGLLAIVGHCFPIWLKFKGGKGVATTLGALLTAVPYAGLAACVTWLLVAFMFKYSSAAALAGIGIAPVFTYFVYGGSPALVCLLITLLVWWRHKENIKRLLNGTEPKIGEKKDTVTKEVAE